MSAGGFESRRVWVKVCGITNLGDATACWEAGADALGFNFYEKSRRALSLDTDLDWIARIPPGILRVAVVVHASGELLASLRSSGCIDAIQFHGDESPATCMAEGGERWFKAVRAKDRPALDAAKSYASPDVLVDAWADGSYGGTGTLANWEMVRDFVVGNPDRRVILAGGLDPGNVVRAIESVRPFGVDVAGGVEASPRRKDMAKVTAFVRAAQGSAWQSRVL